MKRELKERWLKALESGEYKPHETILRKEGTKAMCCLGVLCDIVDPDGWGSVEPAVAWRPAKTTVRAQTHKLSANPHVLRAATVDELGLTDDNMYYLTYINDHHHKYPIDYIREHVDTDD